MVQYKNGNITYIGIREIYPLRIIKQVISMFCSINSSKDTWFDPLKKFVLNKNEIGLDKTKYKLCLYFTDSNMMKYAKLSGLLKMGETDSEFIALSEITAYPLGFILYFNPTDTWEY